jgi:hypothetical protein
MHTACLETTAIFGEIRSRQHIRRAKKCLKANRSMTNPSYINLCRLSLRGY